MSPASISQKNLSHCLVSPQASKGSPVKDPHEAYCRAGRGVTWAHASPLPPVSVTMLRCIGTCALVGLSIAPLRRSQVDSGTPEELAESLTVDTYNIEDPLF